MHAECVANHSPCPDGWNKKEKSGAAEPQCIICPEEPTLPQAAAPPPSTPRPTTDDPATARAKLMNDFEEFLQNRDQQHPHH